MARAACGLLLVLSMLFGGPATAAEAYPTRTVRLVVPWPAGGIVDALGRVLGKRISDAVGQPVVIENRVGAAGAIGAENVAKAPPDGYTLLLASSGHVITAALSKNLPYDSIRDFTPITLVATAPSVLVANPAVPAKTAHELVELAKEKPGKLTYASAGNGSFAHILGELFKHTANIDVLHVPYRGQPQAMTDLLAGRVDLLFATMTVAIPQIEAGNLAGLGVTARHRIPALPNVPTLAEAGIPGFDGGQWFGVLGPKGMSDDVVRAIAREVDKALKDPQVKTAIEVQGMYIVNADAGAFRTTLEQDIQRYTKLIAETGLAASN